MTEQTKWIRAQELLTTDYRCAGCHHTLVATRTLDGIWVDCGCSSGIAVGADVEVVVGS